MDKTSNMEQTVMNFIRKGPDSDGICRMEFEEMRALAQMIFATYNKVNQLCANIHRYEREKAGSMSPSASNNVFF